MSRPFRPSAFPHRRASAAAAYSEAAVAGRGPQRVSVSIVPEDLAGCCGVRAWARRVGDSYAQELEPYLMISRRGVC